jgi:hypothetical protein
MGLAYVAGTVTGPTGVARTSKFLVDSGTTLEMLGFILYPFDRTIRPARMMLA